MAPTSPKMAESQGPSAVLGARQVSSRTVRRGILIVSASMGAGHDGAARELQRRLEAQGHTVTVVDYLTMIPFRLGGFVRWTYLFQLQKMAWSYDLTYHALFKEDGGR